MNNTAKNIEYDEKTLALAEFLECDPDEILEQTWGGFEHGKAEYQVLTDDEADILWDEYLENYIDECLEIPEHLEFYFDREAWKSDAKMDGRGHSLSGYDGCEHESGEFFIYRTN